MGLEEGGLVSWTGISAGMDMVLRTLPGRRLRFAWWPNCGSPSAIYPRANAYWKATAPRRAVDREKASPQAFPARIAATHGVIMTKIAVALGDWLRGKAVHWGRRKLSHKISPQFST